MTDLERQARLVRADLWRCTPEDWHRVCALAAAAPDRYERLTVNQRPALLRTHPPGTRTLFVESL